MSNSPSDQKRGAFRLSAEIDAKFFPVVPTVSRPVSDEIPLKTWLVGSVIDLSVTGMRLSGPLSLGEKAHIAIAFTLPSAFLKEFTKAESVQETGPFGVRNKTIKQSEPDFKPMELLGKIIREAFNEPDSTFQYHVKFVQNRSEDDKELNRFVILQQRWQLKHREHLRGK